MGKRDPRIDDYIREAAPFARPVLRHLRRIVHEAAPGIEETIKWRFPHFVQGGIVCSMAAFKAHCSFGFWKGRHVLGSELAQGEDAMGSSAASRASRTCRRRRRSSAGCAGQSS
jgi:hypothetical protein